MLANCRTFSNSSCTRKPGPVLDGAMVRVEGLGSSYGFLLLPGLTLCEGEGEKERAREERGGKPR